MNIEEILMNRRTVAGCTSEVWAARRAEEEKKKAELVADRIAALMSNAEERVDHLVEKLREVREQERQNKAELDKIGRPFLFAQNGLNGETIRVQQIAPLVLAMDESLEDFALEDTTEVEVPEDFSV